MFALRTTVVVLFLLAWPVGPDAVAQVGLGSTLWAWTDSAAHHEAVVNVSLDGGSGTGIIVAVDRDKPVSDGYEGYCLTANHVVESDNDRRAIKLRYRNGRTVSHCKVVKSDPQSDIALLWVWVPADVRPVRIADREARPNDWLEFAGLGGASDPACCLRTFSSKASVPTNEDILFADVSLLPGDSGGPVFNDHRELVGIISGGWMWWDGKIVTAQGNPISATWPARAANVSVIKKMIDNSAAMLVSRDDSSVTK
ncbi:MAG: trypsin-like peptidase domain-containing protein [Pirellulaceae bacterium]|nr:trypsin-like peptidase domain-containing protein [Pirellulaceae bacterium]